MPRSSWRSSCFLRAFMSAIFRCSCESFFAAALFTCSSSCSCMSRTLHHSFMNLAVSACSLLSFSRMACLRWICASRLRLISSRHRFCAASFSRRLASSTASLACTCRSTRSSSSFIISASRSAWASIMAMRFFCFSLKTSSSFCFRIWSIFSFRAPYSRILSSSSCSLSCSLALISLKYSLARFVSAKALTARPRRLCSAMCSASRSSIALRRSSSPSSIWSSISRYLFSLYSASCSFCALAAILESSSLVSFSFISRSSIFR
mmetsp:Transcript_10033/g.21234  ORF Transcript_10033/g.21234 Transcript_10033/m.21234 type:complete len:264 (-) Transcript_10033:622-1413(-)